MKKFLSTLLAVVMIVAIAPAALAANSSITDLGDNSRYQSDIEAIESLGGLSGLISSDGRFFPAADISRADVRLILTNLFGANIRINGWQENSTVTQADATTLLTDISAQMNNKVVWEGGDRYSTISRGQFCCYVNGMLGQRSGLYRYISNSYYNGNCPSNGQNGYYDSNGIWHYYDGYRFRDVSPSDYFFYPVQWAVREGITSGTSRDTFSPSDSCTIAQFITLLWRAKGSPESNYACPYSSDVVNSNSYAYKALKWANGKGMIPDNTVNPFSTTCTRASACWYMWKAAGSPSQYYGSDFSDVPRDSNYSSAVRWATREGITSGVGNNRFDPYGNVTRAQAITFLYRHLG